MTTIKKKDIQTIFLALKETSLNLADSRLRDAFLKPLGENLDQFNKDRSAIYLQYCEKNEDDTPKIEKDNYHFKNEDLQTINDELETLFNEEITVSIENIDKIKEFVENTTYLPKPGEVEIIDAFIEKL